MIKAITALSIIFLTLCTQSVKAWDSEQLELFDLVEEINTNFYTVMDIPQDANATTIRKAFRSLSLVRHPDKSDAPDADVQFRQLVAVYEVLRDPVKRERYDEILKNGLPNWKSAVYYYRHVRKMGLAEMSIILFVIITIGQYLVGWASFLEKKYTAEQVLGSKLKKQQKKAAKKGQAVADITELVDIKAPTIADTLPVQIPRLLWFLVINVPTFVYLVKSLLSQRIKTAMEKKKPETSDSESDSQQPETKTVRKRKAGFIVPELPDSDLPPKVEPVVSAVPVSEAKPPPPVSGGLWTDDDLAELVMLVKKYPGGTPDRWGKISEAINRSVAEVTYMANKMKENSYRLPGQQEEKPPEEEAVKKQKTKGGKLEKADISAADSSWSQLQQKALENALAKFPKGPADRWDKIAKCVPDKTKEECMLRYKHLVEYVKQKKEQGVDPQ